MTHESVSCPEFGLVVRYHVNLHLMPDREAIAKAALKLTSQLGSTSVITIVLPTGTHEKVSIDEVRLRNAPESQAAEVTWRFAGDDPEM